MHEDGECSHFMKNFDASHQALRIPAAKKLLGHISRTFGTLAFCRRWLEEPSGGSKFLHGDGGQQKRYVGALKNLCDVRAAASWRVCLPCVPAVRVRAPRRSGCGCVCVARCCCWWWC